MSFVRLSSDFSASVIACKIEQRFGLAGFARLVKLLELFGASSERSAGRLSLPLSDALDALRCGRAELELMLSYLSAADFLAFELDVSHSAVLVVVLSQPAPFLGTSADPALLARPCDWATWGRTELSWPPDQVTEPYSQQLFRRWVATNVTTCEAVAAANAQLDTGGDINPPALHAAIARHRAERLARAKS